MIFRFNVLRCWSQPIVAHSGTYPTSWPNDSASNVGVRYLALRPNQDLPFYCRPIILFALVWTMMLAALSLRISYDTYPDMGLPVFLFALSIVSLLLGYGAVAFFGIGSAAGAAGPSSYVIWLQRLRKLNWLLVAAAAAIMVVNLKIDGLPPAFGFLGYDTVTYLEYGRLKQILFPLLISIIVNGSLDPSRLRKITFMFFGFFSLLLYVTRGEILAALLQVFFVYSLTSNVNKRRLLWGGAALVLGMAFIASLVGNNRTTQSSFFAVLQIRREFWEWPMIILWATSYFSIPLSNLCWIIQNFHFQGATLSFLYPALPAFWIPVDPHESVTGYSHVIDGVHTYLATYYMDLSYAGVVLINVVLGCAAAYLVRRGLSRSFLVSAIFLGCLAYIFFVDNFMPLSTLLQIVIQSFAQRYIVSSRVTASEPLG